MTPGVMRREAQKYLFDIRRAAGDLVNFTTGKTREHYLADPVLRAAVERKFEILGEAAGQLGSWRNSTPHWRNRFRITVVWWHFATS